jgi:hypothetical protein
MRETEPNPLPGVLWRSRGKPVSEISQMPLRERAKRYRQLSREARIHAANAKGDEQAAFMMYAGKWEQLALEAEAEAKADEGSHS